MSVIRVLFIVLMVLAAAALITGCGAALKESGGDQTTATEVQEQISQVLDCAGCHTQFGQFLESRHADINNSPNRAGSCSTCHAGLDNIGQYIEPEPKYFVDCASCHEPDGTKHGAINANLRNATLNTPGGQVFPTCTNCHDLNADEDYGSHHYLDSNRYWKNAAGDSVRDADSSVTPIAVDEVIIAAVGGTPAVALSTWVLPAAADTVWSGNYDGPYYFVPDRTIKDTHFNEVWILNEADKVTRYTVPTATFGYVNLDNESPNTGMVNSNDADNACLASCHSPHEFDNIIQKQWANGGHKPIPVGPIVDDGGALYPSGPDAWGAVDHDFSSSCTRCHSSVGFAAVAPGVGSFASSVGDGYITCNACHDGVNYPSPTNKRLRFTGDASLFNKDESVIITVDAGDSAVCISCHQGREDPSRVDGTRFRNMHYLPSAAVLYAEKGYDYSGTYGAYVGPQTAHAETAGNCIGCHMDDLDTPSETVGGHTFEITHDGVDNVEPCQSCHSGITSFTDINASGDWDGDGSTESAEMEIEGLLDELIVVIEAYNMNPVDSTMDVYYQAGYPYFVLTDANQNWDVPLAAATFNWQYIYKDPGAFAHNGKYAAELLRDSFEDLTGTPLNGDRP